MSLVDEDSLQLLDKLKISNSSESKKTPEAFSLHTQSISTPIGNVLSDVVITQFSNRTLVIVTQIGKPGSLFEVKRKDSCVEVKVVLGSQSEELLIAGRAFGEEFELKRPTLFGLGLSSPLEPSLISEIIKILKPLL